MTEALIKAVIGVLVTALWGWFLWLIKRMFKKQKATDEGLQSLLRAELIRTYEKGVDRGYCPIYSKEAFEKCYKAYHDLGGNGVIDEIYQTVMRLPTSKPRV